MTTQLIQKTERGQDLDAQDLDVLKTLLDMKGVEDPLPDPEGKVVERGETPMVRTMKTPGYVQMRRNSDGKLKDINKNQLSERLRQRLPDGRPAWIPPHIPWTGKVRKPTFWCRLSANHPDRAEMDELNLEVCEKRGALMTLAARRRHELRKHKDAYEVLKQHEDDKKQELRDRQQSELSNAIVAAVGGKAVKPAAAVREKHKGGRPKKAVVSKPEGAEAQ